MITIVTAFFDIGRSDWQGYARSTQTYLANFKRLCLLENPIVLFTQTALKTEIDVLAQGKGNLTVFYCDTLFDEHEELLQRIASVQASEIYREGIADPTCPEYNQPKYVLVNYLKSYFCVEAARRLGLSKQMLAWIDFGYLRTNKQLPISLRWNFPFVNKINMFYLQSPEGPIDLVQTIKNNIVYIQGCHIVADTDSWIRMAEFMREALYRLLDDNLIDDDQTLLLMAWQAHEGFFKLYPAVVAKPLGWFFIFRRFNSAEQSLNWLQRIKYWRQVMAHR
jgi:protein YibB